MNVGTYSCLAEAGEDSLQSQIAVLTLAYLSNSFSVHPTSHIQSMGDIVHLQCSIDSSPPPSISWYYNGQPLSDGGVVTSTTLSVLRLGPLEHQQMGVYSCLATNALLPGQQRMSNPATLTILGRPGFITTPSAQSIAVG
uniref:Titin-like n=1 Tax=Saccoglossus kowalevskii TaxID=10224 RepID=A0ABM0MT43_SACKO